MQNFQSSDLRLTRTLFKHTRLIMKKYLYVFKKIARDTKQNSIWIPLPSCKRLILYKTSMKMSLEWACLVKGFNPLVLAGGLNLPDKRVDPECWLRSGLESPRRQLGFKPLSGSYQLRTLHCRATLICASFGGLIIYYHFPYFSNYGLNFGLKQR